MIAGEIKDRIVILAQDGKIPLAEYGRNYGGGDEMGKFSFGGYAFDPSELTKPIIAAMRNAQIEAFQKSRTQEAKRLFGLLCDDLDAFGREFAWNNSGASYCQTAILHEIDATEFAEVVFRYVTSGHFEAIGDQLQALANRHRPDNFPEELVWANKVKSTLEKLAEDAGQLEKARMVWFLGFNWRFSTGDSGDG